MDPSDSTHKEVSTQQEAPNVVQSQTVVLVSEQGVEYLTPGLSGESIKVQKQNEGDRRS